MDSRSCLLIVTLLDHGNITKWSRKTEAVLEHLSLFVHKLELEHLSTWTLAHLNNCLWTFVFYNNVRWWTFEQLSLLSISSWTQCQVVKLDMIDAVLEHLTKDFFPDEPIFRWNIITPESCENLVRFPFPYADIHKHVSWEDLTMKTRKKSCIEAIDVYYDLNTFICCKLLSGRSASTFPMEPWCGSTRSLWSRDSVLLLSIQRGKYLAFALGWSSKSKQKIHAIRSYIIIENDNKDMHTK